MNAAIKGRKRNARAVKISCFSQHLKQLTFKQLFDPLLSTLLCGFWGASLVTGYFPLYLTYFEFSTGNRLFVIVMYFLEWTYNRDVLKEHSFEMVAYYR